VRKNLEEAAKRNVDNAVVLARLFNEARGQRTPSKKHGLFISYP
jgi:hypothetical protein